MTEAIALPRTEEATERPIYVQRPAEELEEIATRQPTNPMPLYLLADVLRRRGDDTWKAAVASARQRPHRTPQQLYARALSKMLCGDWDGWSEYNVRVHGPEAKRGLAPYNELCWRHQEWDGHEDLAGKTLVVLPEQGLGDVLQMLRLVPALADMVDTPVLMLYPEVVRFAQHNFGPRVKVWLNHVKPTSTFDRYIWSMSLPSVIGALPTFTPLVAPKRRASLPPRNGLRRAGVCWAGRPTYLHDPDRSIPFDRLTPLFARPGMEWFSLQVGPRASDAAACPDLRAPNPSLVTFADTADVVAELDYVVTVDTSVAHLAGLMGVPTYLLLQADSHWRWGLDVTTPWYPSMRLIRQHAFGDWDNAVEDLIALLDAHC